MQGELAQKPHESSRAKKPPARAESELIQAELSSDASLFSTYIFKVVVASTLNFLAISMGEINTLQKYSFWERVDRQSKDS